MPSTDERFLVGETNGRLTPSVGSLRGKVGLTAFVYDTLNACKVIAEFRSEDYRPFNGIGTPQMLGREGAREFALREANRLNELYREA